MSQRQCTTQMYYSKYHKTLLWVYKMIIEFKQYDDGRYYYHYITNDIRICTDGTEMTIENRDYDIKKIRNMWHYLNPSDEMLFQLGTLSDYVADICRAVTVLDTIMNG